MDVERREARRFGGHGPRGCGQLQPVLRGRNVWFARGIFRQRGRRDHSQRRDAGPHRPRTRSCTCGGRPRLRVLWTALPRLGRSLQAQLGGAFLRPCGRAMGRQLDLPPDQRRRHGIVDRRSERGDEPRHARHGGAHGLGGPRCRTSRLAR